MTARWILVALTATLLGAGCDRADAPQSAPGEDRSATPTEGGVAGRSATAVAGRAGEVAADPGPGDLVDEARERGLTYVNRSGTPEKSTILEANGAGVALIDLSADGDLDIVFAQGLSSLAQLRSGPGADLEVFVNDGSGRFERASGPGVAGWWNGLAVGDVDGDGDQDLVASGFGDLVLLLQDGHGRLAPAAEAGLVASDPRDAPGGAAGDARGDASKRWVVGAAREAGGAPMWPTSLALFDADRDGHLDLYVCQYLDLDPAAPPRGALGSGALAVPCRWKGYDVFCGPAGMTPQHDRILRGRGDGTFEETTQEWLPGQAPSSALGVAPFDADGDGDTDLYVANDGMANQLWINDGRGVFTDRAYAAGVALSADGRPLAGMGVATGDVNGDGMPDLAVTNFSDEPTELFLGSARGFEDATYRYGLHAETRRQLKWGVHLLDFDGDGWLELFQANGHVYPQADRDHTGTSYGQRASLWHLGPEPKAVRVEPASERSIFFPAAGTRGTAVGDLDRDGRPDVVLARIDGPAALGMNRMRPARHRLSIRCMGPESPRNALPRTPRDGMGTRVAVVVGAGAAERGLYGEVQTAVGYQSASTPWLHFGLGDAAGYRGIRVVWPSGRVEALPAGPADRRITVREGDGIVASEAFR